MRKFKVRNMNNNWVIVDFLNNGDIHFLSNAGSVYVMIDGSSTSKIGKDYYWPTRDDASIYLTEYLRSIKEGTDDRK